VTTAAGWRSVFWICAGYGVFLFLFLFLFFPETYRLDHQWDQTFTQLQSQTNLAKRQPSPVVNTSTDSINENDSSVKLPHATSTVVNTTPPEQNPHTLAIPSKSRFNPFQSFSMLKYLFVCFVAIEIGFCFGTMFTLETLIPDLYYIHYGFDSWQTGKLQLLLFFIFVCQLISYLLNLKYSGLSFIGAGLGNVLGSIVSGKLSDYLLIRSKNRRGGISKAEDRLTLNAWYVHHKCIT
jgi:MFS family permease